MSGKGVCFVIAPMGEESSDTRHRAKEYFSILSSQPPKGVAIPLSMRWTFPDRAS